MGDHLIDVDVDVWGSGRMADDNLLTDLLILSSCITPLDGMEEESKRKTTRDKDQSILFSLYSRHDVQ